MSTTIKIAPETKTRLVNLDIAEKGKSFDMIVNDLMTFYNKYTGQYKKDYKKWQESQKKYQKDYSKYEIQKKKYEDEKLVWDKLLIWAKEQGFKP